MRVNWDKVIDGIQILMIFTLIVTVAACILSLIFFDGVVGTGSMMYLTNKNVKASIGISAATTGLLMSLMFAGYNMVSKNKSTFFKSIGVFVLIVAGVVYCLDVYFDALTADYLRFGEFVALNSLPANVRNVQILFRILIGGLSTVGEGLAVAIVLGMPVLKDVISDAIPNKGKQQQQQPQKQKYIPKHRPNFSRMADEALDRLPKG